MALTLLERSHTPTPRAWVSQLLEVWRVVLVAGLLVGLVVIGIGSRVTMFLLRLTSSDNARGVVSDDGFVVGRFSLAGSYGLVQLGAVVGVIGAAACVAVAPWLIGPRWFRWITVSVTAGLLVGSMVIHAEGVDFVLLGPLWFSVSLFIGLPVVAGTALAWAVDAVAAHRGWATQRPWAWLLPLLLALTVPLVTPLILLVLAVVAALLPLGRLMVRWSHNSDAACWVIRAGFMVIPASAAVALNNDLRALF